MTTLCTVRATYVNVCIIVDNEMELEMMILKEDTIILRNFEFSFEFYYSAF